ncbi:hypothetical protein LJR219_004239 [Phenylobacterium sp. LjRoot219]|uniref:hypothetical protein n=1 Tax=Phenylobacterium sp. LjRoot219 TaxID=3342283 RepID=UPI003ECC7B2D
MTLVSAIGQARLHHAGSSLCMSRRSSALGPRVDDDGVYGVVRRWPAWLRLPFIAALGLAVWASVILTALPLLP